MTYTESESKEDKNIRTNASGQIRLIHYVNDKGMINYSIPGLRSFAPLYCTKEEFDLWLVS